MLILIRFCCRAYDFSLRCYPVALRETFGAEMSFVFRQQMNEAWEERGFSMLLPVIYYGIRELFTEALPARVASPVVIAGGSSFVCTSAVFWCLMWALGNPLAVKALADRIHRTLWG